MSGIEISEDEFNSLLRLITDGKAQAAAVIQEIFDYFGEKNDAPTGAELLAKIIFLKWRGTQLWLIYKECNCNMAQFQARINKDYALLETASETEGMI